MPGFGLTLSRTHSKSRPVPGPSRSGRTCTTPRHGSSPEWFVGRRRDWDRAVFAFRRSIHRAHAEIEVADAVAVGIGDGEREVEAQGDRAHLGNEHADTSTDRGPDLGEGVISLDG